LVPADFTKDDVDAALGAAGHDSDQGTFFLCEGVLVFLDERAIADLLRSLRRRATPDSVLAVQFSLRPSNQWHRAQRAAFDFVISLVGEHPRTLLAPEEPLERLRQAGWVPRNVVDPSELNDKARPGHALLVSACPAEDHPHRGLDS
jgi:O-methyltransferase involved in polyketide biosynthesis